MTGGQFIAHPDGQVRTIVERGLLWASRLGPAG
jgi:type 1 glutamine amidotransferase